MKIVKAVKGMKNMKGSPYTKRVVRENLYSILIAVVISSIGGMLLKSSQEGLIAIPALLVLIPALNDMAGDFGCIIASRFTTMIYAKTVQVHSYRYTDFRIIPKELAERLRKRRVARPVVSPKMLRMLDNATRSYASIFNTSLDILRNKRFLEFVRTIFLVAFLSSVYLGVAVIAVCFLAGFETPPYSKLMVISISCGVCLVFSVMASALLVSIVALKNTWDLDNVIIPIVTSIGDMSGICFLLIGARLSGVI